MMRTPHHMAILVNALLANIFPVIRSYTSSTLMSRLLASRPLTTMHLTIALHQKIASYLQKAL